MGKRPVGAHARVDPPALVRGRRALVATVLLIVAATIVGVFLLSGGDAEGDVPERGERVKGTVTALQTIPCADAPEASPAAGDETCAEATVRIEEGPDRGQSVSLITGEPEYTVGKDVVLAKAGEEVPVEERYELIDVQRGQPLVVLGAIFLAAIVALGRFRGFLSVAGLCVSLVVLVEFLVPSLLAGHPPLLTALVGGSAVMVAVLFLAHGFNLRTATAMVGTSASLLLTIGLARVFVELAGLTGLSSDEASYVQSTFGDVDLRGLLLAGIVIGSLGILDDVTVTQVSTVYELRSANPTMPAREIYAAAQRVGQDHIASTVNTLLLAYAGASLPLLVVFATSGEGLIGTLTNSVVAEEVVRTLVGSIGLIAAVPFTTALATFMCPPEGTAPRAPRRTDAADPAPAEPSAAPLEEEAPRSSTSWGD